MKASPAFQFYPHDFLIGTADMSPEEVGAYIRLLCYQWSKGCLPNDDKKLASMAGCDGIIVASIRHKFRVCEDGYLRNERMEDVRAEQSEYRQKQSEIAKNGWLKRKNQADDKPEHRLPIANPLPSDSVGDAKTMPESSTSSSPSIYNTFITRFNEVRKSNFRGNKKIQSSFEARLKEGFTVDDIILATKEAMGEQNHIEVNFKYITPEFMVRIDKLERFLNQAKSKGTKILTSKEKPDMTGWNEKQIYIWRTKNEEKFADLYRSAEANQFIASYEEKTGRYKDYFDQQTLRFKSNQE